MLHWLETPPSLLAFGNEDTNLLGHKCRGLTLRST
jgi:hypothetical protein